MGLSKVMTVTCTYDHRVIQGAESGMFLAQLQALLEGEDEFYDRIFRDLGIPLQPVRWEVGSGRGAGGQCRSPEAGGGRAADPGLARARASGRRYRSAGRAAPAASRSRAVGARAHDLGSGPHVSRRLVRRGARCAS